MSEVKEGDFTVGELVELLQKFQKAYQVGHQPVLAAHYKDVISCLKAVINARVKEL